MKDELVVYWAPDFIENQQFDWNILYNNPTSAWNDVKEKIDKNSNSPQIAACPAVKDILKNTFCFSSSAAANYVYDINNKTFVSRIKSYIGLDEVRSPNLKNKLQLTLGLSWIFFCEEPLKIEITPPYFSDAKHLGYGSVVPGTFDVGQWFRPYLAEFILRKDVTEFVLENDEPIFFARFFTDRDVVLKRFVMDEKLKRLERSCAASGNIFGRSMSLDSRYAIFKNTGTNKKISSIIKANAID